MQSVIKQHNESHASRHKVGAYGTQEARALGMFRSFRLLHSADYLVGPGALRVRHVDFLVRNRVAGTSVCELLLARGNRLAPRMPPLSSAYIQQQLSFLRTLCVWIGKPGLVRPAPHYVVAADLASRATHAARDGTWSAANVAC